ncbi:MerR family transcriptional regulator [Bacteriovoracaceae bacterium]|nr:MerR family transcriptional regulator [Bacteriovoracaceae bacterium]
MMTIKEFSQKVDYSIRMLRYLEDFGLLIPRRDANNYRMYSKLQIEEAKRVKKIQSLGLQLKEIELLLFQENSEQVVLLERALKREKEIAELKSGSIPELRKIIDFLKIEGTNLDSYFNKEAEGPRKIHIIGNDERFQRTAYNIPILRNIYEDHLTNDANIELIATDLIKFNIWFLNTDYIPDTFSVLKGTSFAFGENITNEFIDGYEISWKKFLPEMGFIREAGFNKEDIGQLMGPHDILIRSIFKYKNTGLQGEILIPYSSIYTLSQLSSRS